MLIAIGTLQLFTLVLGIVNTICLVGGINYLDSKWKSVEVRDSKKADGETW